MAETHTVGRVIQHEGDAPPAEDVAPTSPGEQRVETELDATRPPRLRAKPAKRPRAPKKTTAVKKAEAQRRKRLAKRK
jgi:hypothetical protein